MLVPIPVREVMQSPVETIEPDQSVRTAATRLIERNVGSLVVCENGSPVGILTDADVTELVAEGRDPATAVADVMSAPLVTIETDAAIETAAQRLREQGIKRLPVIEDGEVVGIVTTTDLSAFLPHLVRAGREDPPAEGRDRERVRVDTAYELDDWDFEFLGRQDSIDVGDTVRFSKSLSDADVEAFAEASGDTNRLHLDDGYAADTRFGGRIAHGTLVVGVISAALARLPGLIIYLSQDVSYLGPVPVGDRVTAECEVVETIGSKRFRLTTTVSTDDGEQVVDGEAVVLADEVPTQSE